MSRYIAELFSQHLQEGYETECKAVFEALQELNDRLASRRYLINNIVAGAHQSSVLHVDNMTCLSACRRSDSVCGSD